MKCRPNDHAIVVSNTHALPCNLIGTPITVTESFDTSAGPAWLYYGRTLRCPDCRMPVFAFLDADLHPIRGAGQGAQAIVSEPIQGLTVIEEPMPCQTS